MAGQDDRNGGANSFALRIAAIHPLSQPDIELLLGAIKIGPPVGARSPLGPQMRSGVPILLEGMACQFKLLGSGRRQITSILVPGDFCHFGFLSGARTDENFFSLSPCRVGRIEMATFADMCERSPEIMRAVLRCAGAESAIRQEHIVSLGLRTALERVCHLLSELHDRLAMVDLVRPDASFEFPLTQAELGEALGLSTVHINRMVQAMRQRGLIALGQGRVVVQDITRLNAAAGFDRSYMLT